jgi:putative transposase
MSDSDVNESYRISDQLWEQIEPLLSPELPKPKGGRPRMDNRKAMEAIFYLFRTGCKWKEIPRSFGAPSTVRNRFKEWQRAGLFQRMWQAGLITYDELRAFIWHGRKKIEK